MKALIRISIMFWAVVALGYLPLAVALIARGDWGTVVNIAWLKPGVEFLSLDFLLYVLVSGSFIAAGVAIMMRWRNAPCLCALGFAGALASLFVLSPIGLKEDEVSVAFAFFVFPALVYVLCGAMELRDRSWLMDSREQLPNWR